MLRARGRAFLGAAAGIAFVAHVSWPRAVALFLLSAVGRRLFGFHGFLRDSKGRIVVVPALR